MSRSPNDRVGWCNDCLIRRQMRSLDVCWRCYCTRRDSNTVKDEDEEEDDIDNLVGDARYMRHKPLPPTPTQHLPGTAEKVAILEERCRLGFQLWHPLDASYNVMMNSGKEVIV